MFGPIGVGAAATGPFASQSNLYVTRNADGAGLFVGNAYNSTNASGIFSMSSYGTALGAYTQSGYAVYVIVGFFSGYAGRFDGAVWLDRIDVNLSTGAGGFELGDMTRLQQEKIEELFLYIIRLEKCVKELEAKRDDNSTTSAKTIKQ